MPRRYTAARLHIRIERTYLTTQSGTRVIDAKPELVTVESESLKDAILAFIHEDGGRLLGTVSESDGRAVATAWKNRVYLLSAQVAPD